MTGERRAALYDTATAILLSVAGLASAWASYQSGLWDGEQANFYTVANGKLTEAGRLAVADGQETGLDVALFMQWLNAAAAGDKQLMAFYASRFQPEFRTAFAAWRARLPLDLRQAKPGQAGPAVLPRIVHAAASQAERLRREAAVAYDAGQHANAIGDRFTAATVILAMVLFLGGIGAMLKSDGARLGLLCLSSLLCVGALVWIVTLPVASL